MVKKTINHRGVLYSKGKQDENYTPAYAVQPIIKYIPKNYRVWCPFDKDNSEFVKKIKKNGYEVINSHIDYGEDFYQYEPDNWDCIISNPPFTNKKKIFERCLDLGKPFALLMTVVWLNDSAPKMIFIKRNRQLQLLLFDKRIEYLDKNGVCRGRPSFGSAYFCCDFLPNDLIHEELNIKDELYTQTKLL